VQVQLLKMLGAPPPRRIFLLLLAACAQPLVAGGTPARRSLSSCECTDVQPPGSFTCRQQKSWGKCSAPWMAGFCEVTCAACSCGSAGTCECYDEPPPWSTKECRVHESLGQCSEFWMLGYCEKTCKSCPCAPRAELSASREEQPRAALVVRPGPGGASDDRIKITIPTPKASTGVTVRPPALPTVLPSPPGRPSTAEAGCYEAGSALDFLRQLEARWNISVFPKAAQLEGPGIAALMSDPAQPVTVLVPTDEAWAASLGRAGLDLRDVVEDPDLLRALLLTHVLPGALSSAALSVGVTADSMLLGTQVLAAETAGGTLLLSTPASEVVVGERDLALCGGGAVFHFVDGLLWPYGEGDEPPGEPEETPAGCSADSILGELRSSPDMGTVAALVEAAGPAWLLEPASGVTLLAPTDAAFDALGSRPDLPAPDGGSDLFTSYSGVSAFARSWGSLSREPLQPDRSPTPLARGLAQQETPPGGDVTVGDLLSDPSLARAVLGTWTLPGVRRESSMRDGMVLQSLDARNPGTQVSIDAESGRISLIDVGRRASNVVPSVVGHVCGAAVVALDSLPLPKGGLPALSGGQADPEDALLLGADGRASPIPLAESLGGPGDPATAGGSSCRTIREVIEDYGHASEIVRIADSSGAGFLFDQQAPVTLFVPEDLALSGFQSERGLSPLVLLQSPSTAVSVIAYSVVPEEAVGRAGLEDGRELQTLVVGNDGPLAVGVSVVKGAVFLSGIGSRVRVVAGDLRACDGAVVHIVDGILLPFSLSPDALAPAPPAPAPADTSGTPPAPPACKSVMAIAEDVPQLSVFVQWAKATGVDDDWRDPGRAMTVFIPSDDAVKASLAFLPDGAKGFAYNPALLELYMRYHMLDGARTTDELLEAGELPTMLAPAATLRFEGAPGTVRVFDAMNPEGSKIVVPDVAACKAVVHVVSFPLILAPETFQEEQRRLGLSGGAGAAGSIVNVPPTGVGGPAPQPAAAPPAPGVVPGPGELPGVGLDLDLAASPEADG